jgi:hypothetical protein
MAPRASLSPPFHFHRPRRLLGLSAMAQQRRASLHGSGIRRGKGREGGHPLPTPPAAWPRGPAAPAPCGLPRWVGERDARPVCTARGERYVRPVCTGTGGGEGARGRAPARLRSTPSSAARRFSLANAARSDDSCACAGRPSARVTGHGLGSTNLGRRTKRPSFSPLLHPGGAAPRGRAGGGGGRQRCASDLYGAGERCASDLYREGGGGGGRAWSCASARDCGCASPAPRPARAVRIA